MKEYFVRASEVKELEGIINEKISTQATTPWALVLDFDGVLSSKTEDWIYHLQEEPNEAEDLHEIAKAFELDLSGYDIPYQRHLLYQVAAAELGIPIEAGPALKSAIVSRSSRAKLYVLTARSGLLATLRMRDFLEERALEPTEIYQIGRVPKDRQIKLLLDTLRDHDVLFIEDSKHHVDLIKQSFLDSGYSSRLEIVMIEHDESQKDSDSLREMAWDVMKSAAAHRHLGEKDDRSRAI